MSALRSAYLRLGLAVAAGTIALDQAHKWYMLLVYRIQERGRVSVTPFMDIVFVKNEGISYGLFTQGSMAGQWLLAGFAVLASALMTLWLGQDGFDYAFQADYARLWAMEIEGIREVAA